MFSIIDLIILLIALCGWIFFIGGIIFLFRTRYTLKKYGKCPECNGMGTVKPWSAQESVIKYGESGGES